jgi:signal transduction histidine kinase
LSKQNYQLPITNYHLPITNYRLPITYSQSYIVFLRDISGYPDELAQVRTNLIHNSVQEMDCKETREIGVDRKAQNIVVKITDSGCGIAPDIQDRIFNHFLLPNQQEKAEV